MSKDERTGWRDEALSNRHRDWGFNVPAIDVDFLMVEYDNATPAALIDYKRKDNTKLPPKNSNAKALINLADQAAVPALFVYYGEALDWFVVRGLNEKGRNLEAKIQTSSLSETEYVKLLYWLRDRKAPSEVLSVLRIEKTDLQCHHGAKPEDCYCCSGAMHTLREAGIWPKSDWKAQVRRMMEAATRAASKTLHLRSIQSLQ